MTADQPIKFRILELFLDDKEHWNNEIVNQIQDEYNLQGNYWRDGINFDIIELTSGGMLKAMETKVDEEGTYKKNYLLHKYMITDFGKTRASEACLEYV
ncbi:hypothetical protein [Methanococcoides sp. AM1]|uniref:hypothetical protein n=1 Tax=Methanococcoides sp. AM1 TaxID=1201011 RepID=UPI001083D529|nr:hypothetical protein [Methanococcoides sp. AM1]